MKCPDQELCKQILQHLVPIQQGDAKPKDFPVATRDEMQAIRDAEEMEVMYAELGMM